MIRARSILAVIAVLAALLLAPGIASGQTEPALWRFIQPDSKALISIDWRRLSHSHVGGILREKWINNSGGAIPGIEFLDDVDRFIIASQEREGSGEDSKAPMLIIARGKFDTAKVQRVLRAHGAKPQMFNGIAVFRPQGKGNKDMAFVVLDAQTILIGDAQSVFHSLDQNRSPEPPPNPLSARAAEMDATYDVWAIIQGTGAIASNRLTELFSGGALGAEPQTFEAGISVRNGLIADILLKLPSEMAAKSLASELSQLFKAAVRDKTGDPAFLELERKMKVSSDGPVAKISLRLNPQELEKNARTFAATRKAPIDAAVAGVQPLPAAPSAAAVPPKPSVIRIEGLDEGPREIPYKPERQQ